MPILLLVGFVRIADDIALSVGSSQTVETAANCAQALDVLWRKGEAIEEIVFNRRHQSDEEADQFLEILEEDWPEIKVKTII